MKKRVFITGGTGFVGANLTRAFLDKNYEVHLLLRKRSKKWRITDVSSRCIIHIGDLHNEVLLKKILEKSNPDYIVHLATYGAYSSQTDLNTMIQTNIVGLSHLLNASKNISYKLFINTGSSSEYGYKSKSMKESDLLEPNSYYSATKASATLLAQAFAKKENKPIVTVRLFSVYGPYEEPTRLVPTAIMSALQQKPFSVTSGIVKRDFIYIEDVIQAYMSAIKQGKLLTGEIINIGTGKQWDNKDVAHIIKQLNGGQLVIAKGKFPKRNWDTPYWIADITKTKKLLVWKPAFTLKQGLTKTFQWFSQLEKKSTYDTL